MKIFILGLLMFGGCHLPIEDQCDRNISDCDRSRRRTTRDYEYIPSYEECYQETTFDYEPYRCYSKVDTLGEVWADCCHWDISDDCDEIRCFYEDFNRGSYCGWEYEDTKCFQAQE